MPASASNSTGGQVNWSYSVADGATDYLSAGQVVTETYKIEVDDNHVRKAFQPVTVTITGTNEDTVITLSSSGAVTRDPHSFPTRRSSDLGTVSFTDVDLADTHSAVTPVSFV